MRIIRIEKYYVPNHDHYDCVHFYWVEDQSSTVVGTKPFSMPSRSMVNKRSGKYICTDVLPCCLPMLQSRTHFWNEFTWFFMENKKKKTKTKIKKKIINVPFSCEILIDIPRRQRLTEMPNKIGTIGLFYKIHKSTQILPMKLRHRRNAFWNCIEMETHWI